MYFPVTEAQSDRKANQASPHGEEAPPPKGSRGIPALKKRISSEEEPRLISSTPEGEKYFQKQAEVLYEKAAAGELDVEVPRIDEQGASRPSSGLVVQLQEDQIPGEGEGGGGSSGSHIDIEDLSTEPLLAVKPLRRIAAASAALSSFEALYDKAELEEVPGDPVLGGEQLHPDRRFQGTRPADVGLPGLSSFENIYELQESAAAYPPPGALAVEELPGARWSAPADSLEPPLLVQEEFDQRYGAAQEKVGERPGNVTDLVAAEGGSDARKSEKG